MRENNSIKKIELLYFNDCPSWKNTLDDLKAILKDLDLNISVSLVNVETYNDALKFKFTGSPTIRVNNKDIFPTNQTNFALGCRIYQTAQGYQGSPTKEMIAEKIHAIII